MTLQQLKYVITVAENGTITEAANKLYISQPSLTKWVGYSFKLWTTLFLCILQCCFCKL